MATEARSEVAGGLGARESATGGDDGAPPKRIKTGRKSRDLMGLTENGTYAELLQVAAALPPPSERSIRRVDSSRLPQRDPAGPTPPAQPPFPRPLPPSLA